MTVRFLIIIMHFLRCILIILNYVYRVAENFRGALLRNVCGCNIRFNAKKPHPPQSLHVKYRRMGVSPSFNFALTALPSKNAKFAPRENFPL